MGKRMMEKRILSCVLSAGMILSLMPQNLVLAADVPEKIYAAAYQDAAGLEDTGLPAQISLNGEMADVNWDWESSDFALPYDTVFIDGTTDDGTGVTAQVEVVPKQENELVYFIDAGRDGGNESKSFDNVKNLEPDSLKNQAADQVYDAQSGWGRIGSNFKLKATDGLDVTQKYQTGYYSASKTESLNYQYYLEAGQYTVTAGIYEWWNNSRSVKLALSGEGMEPAVSKSLTISGSASTDSKSLVFTVDSPCTVTMEVQNATGGEAPTLSWFAVAKGEVEFPEVPSKTVDVTINGDDVAAAAENQNGLTYKGFGILSGNSTSDLLMDYKQESPEVYQEMLQVLFGGEHPLMTHVKMEMGNDGNNSTGADSCTMRFENEEADVSRSPGFQLAADAKKINPDVKVSILYWEMPAWVKSAWNSDRTGAGYNALYKWYRETVFDAYEKYGYVIDYINPDKNETQDPNGDLIKWFKNKLVSETDFPSYMTEEAREAYHNIKIIASDENTTLNIVPKMRADADLYNAVDAVGFHYRAGDATSTADYRTLADVDDKEVWYSEGCATFSYTEYQENKTTEYGAGTIGGYQSPLALADNFIKSFVYSRKTHYIFQPALGSFYEGAQYDHKEILSAREPWAGYVHYDPVIYMLEHFSKFSNTGWENSDNTEGIWRVLPNASGNDSSGSDHLRNDNGNPSYMTLASPDKKDFSVVVVNNSDKTLAYRVTPVNMGLASGAPVEIWETKTDSYMQYQGEAACTDGTYNVVVKPFSMVTLTTLDCDAEEEYTKRLPKDTNKDVLDVDADLLYADDYEYEGYPADYLEKRGNEPRYTVDFTGAFAVVDGKMKQLLNQSVSQWNNYEPNCVVGDFRWMNYKASADVEVGASGYAGINIRQQTGMGFEGSGYNLRITRDGKWTLKKRSAVLAEGNVTSNAQGAYNLALQGKGAVITAWVDGKEVASYLDEQPEYFGRVRFGSGWSETSFDNLKVEKLEKTIPYATDLIDNAADEVSYKGSWDIIAGGGGGSNEWYRSTSTSGTSGSSFQFRMNGGGFALVGQNDGSAVLDVEVDGKTVAADAAVMASEQHGAAYLHTGLEDGEHEVTVTLKSGKLLLDAILYLPYQEVKDSDVAAAEELSIAIYEGDGAALPEKVTCTRADGIQEERNVTWNTDAVTFRAYEKTKIKGTIDGDGFEVWATVETVPEDLLYFVSAGTAAGYFNNNTAAAVSKPYEAIAGLVSGLKNKASDAAYTDALGWGYVADGNTYKVSATVDGGDRPDTYTSTDKYTVGVRDKTVGTQPMIYRFTLEAGTYTLTAGYHEFYGANRVRDMQPSVVWTDESGKRQEVKGSLVELRSADQKGDITFTLNQKATVEYHLNKVSGEAPMFSWLAVAGKESEAVEPADKDVLSDMIQQAKALVKDQYTAESFAAVETALKEAEKVMADDCAEQSQVDEAAAELQKAVNALVKANETPDTETPDTETPDTETPDTETPPTEEPEPPVIKTRLAAPTVTAVKSAAEKTGSVVKITVAKVPNADAYTVYRKVGKKVVTIGTTKTGSIQDQRPVSGKKAIYYATASSQDARYTVSAAGKQKTITLAKDTAKVKVKKSGKHVAVSYKKVKGAKGYLIYRSTKKNGVYTKLTKKPVKSLKYTDKKTKAKKTYYYKVVAYGKNRTYSAGKISAKVKR